MKLPNGYGSIVKLSGKRRKPWAVRVSYLEEQADGTIKRKKRYIGYFVKKESAIAFLTEYNNNGGIIPEHQKYSEIPTFAELFDKWKSYRNSLKTKPGASTWKNYGIAFNMFSPIHDKKIISIRAQDLQNCISAQSSKSRSSVGNMRAIVRGMWKYAVMNEYCEHDIT